MNSYKLGFGLLAIIAIVLAYLYATPDKAPTPSPLAATVAHLEAANTAARAPFPAPPPATETARRGVSAAAANPPAPSTALPAKLEALLDEIHSLLQEISNLQQLIYNPYDPYQPVNEAIREAYQPRIDELSERLDQRFAQAKDISIPQTLRAMWEQILNIGLEDPASSHALSLMSYALDDALFEDMLSVLASGEYSGVARSNLAFSTLLPPETRYYDSNVTATTVQPATPRQQRIKEFIETQLPRETDPELLSTYLNVYQTMSRDAHGLVSPTQFAQQVENLRNHLAPDQYFSFRLQQQALTSANTDVPTLLRDLNSTAMTPQQRQGMMAALSNTVFMELSPNAAESNVNRVIPEQHRQLLLQHLASGLYQPTLQDRYALSDYGSQRYAMELLKNQAQADNTYYQSIVDSKLLAEQVGLILGAQMAGTPVINKLQNNVALREQLAKHLQLPNLSADARTTLQDALDAITPESPMLDESGYVPEAAPDSSSPDTQSLGY
ncbi:MAG: hypothetical protein BWK73_07675 [Thiothrix lacustris]|uniref:Uncharacterized protein n=1 Tax=Thiothrix lacustris TaxID=525917 RepID=A0A1Y1QW48_9GAMM|nr:MAG: hypothetical protein BWK73_07675 [Thiothrix lacustris]